MRAGAIDMAGAGTAGGADGGADGGAAGGGGGAEGVGTVGATWKQLLIRQLMFDGVPTNALYEYFNSKSVSAVEYECSRVRMHCTSISTQSRCVKSSLYCTLINHCFTARTRIDPCYTVCTLINRCYTRCALINRCYTVCTPINHCRCVKSSLYCMYTD
jgi:hypothetical protein